MAIIEWNDQRFRLGVDAMDDSHIEFVELVNEIEHADGAVFARVFDTLVEHSREHFEQERKLMIRSRFPALAEHCSDHERVLGELDKFNLRVHRGLIAFGRNYIRDSMASWFHLHSATMDSALAAHLRSMPADPAELLAALESGPPTG